MIIEETPLFQNFAILPTWLWYSQLQNTAIPIVAFSSHNFKILPTFDMDFFGLVIPPSFFFNIGRNYVSIIITIVSIFAVLVSHNAIFLYISCLWATVSIKTPARCLPSLPFFYQVFSRFLVRCYCTFVSPFFYWWFWCRISCWLIIV